MKTEATLTPDEALLEKMSPRAATRWKVLPLKKDGSGAVHIATAEPDNLELLDNMKILLGAPVVPVPVGEEALKKALEQHLGLGAQAIDDLGGIEPAEGSTDPHLAANDTAMVRFVNDLIQQAQKERATDIHIEPFENGPQVRFRIDGLLHPMPMPNRLKKFLPLLTSRIKVMAQMNIAEKRLPQDGRILFQKEGEWDIRVSVVPTLYGEMIDLRLLPRARMALGLSQLGMGQNERDAIERLIQKPNGILLVTGPTGHGKTTTLYACLSHINTSDRKIITIEDPPEIRMKGVNQIQVHGKIGLTFANGLRSILRQDPDVIMVGEIRDMDTAEIAIRASLTGHLVLSTLHTNDAVGAVTRLLDMGIEPYLVASSVRAVVAQRLVRLVCLRCSKNSIRGCAECRGSGFRGRMGLFELFLIDDDARGLIVKRAPASALREQATKNGMRTLFQDGQTKTGAGLTTTEEVLRVTEEL